MRFALMTEPHQGLSYLEILAIARTAEAAGFEAFFRSDHFGSFPQGAGMASTDCWATLAGLARDTERIGLGSLVSPVTFRIPGAFAKLVATVHDMSGGRVEAGVGAGWNDVEHAQLGIPYPGDGDRVDQLEEELMILRGLWDGPDGWSFEGAHWQVRQSSFVPRAARRPRLIVGGSGRPRSLRLAARHADEYNIASSGPAQCRTAFDALDAACRDIGREAGTVARSVMVGVVVGRDDGEVHDRVSALLASIGTPDRDAAAWMEERRPRWIIGPPGVARERVAEFAAAGAERIMLQDLLPRDHDHVRLMGEIFLD
jgi:alkanesulfonate monooxygenase SsuD/methylene tetrahydromethanopterin reductase-like flavin-dependent oxidoreductase (luciferase family)